MAMRYPVVTVLRQTCRYCKGLIAENLPYFWNGHQAICERCLKKKHCALLWRKTSSILRGHTQKACE